MESGMYGTETIPNKTVVQRILNYVGLGPENGEEYGSVSHSQTMGNSIANHRSSIADRSNSSQQVYQAPTSAPSEVPQVIEVKDFEDCQKIANSYKQNGVVVLNLETTNPKYTRRVVDFASGLVYGLGGNIQKVTTQAFILLPPNSGFNANGLQSYLREAEMSA